MVLKWRDCSSDCQGWAFPSLLSCLYFSAGFQFPPAMRITSRILKKKKEQVCNKVFPMGNEV